MSTHQIVDSIRAVLPRLRESSFRLQPSPDAVMANNEKYQPIFPYSLHSHPFFEWMWCVEGDAFIRIRNEVYHLEAGDFCLLAPGDVHEDVYLPSLAPYRMMICTYRDETIYSSTNTYIPVNRMECNSMLFAPAPPFTGSLLEALEHELKTGQVHSDVVCSGLVLSLAHLMLRAFESPFPLRDRKSFPGKISQRVDNYLHLHFDKPLVLEDIASSMRMSRNYLITLYRQEVGKTIGQKLTEIRLEYAKKLLLETNLSVQEVSRSVGYLTPEHFGRIFRRYMGITPKQYSKTSGETKEYKS